MDLKAVTTITAVSPDGCTITATLLGAASTLTLSDGHLILSCKLQSPLPEALRDEVALAARLMHAAGCAPDSKSCAAQAKKITLQQRRRAEISQAEAAFLYREAIGLIEEAGDQDELPDALMERFWGADWAHNIPRLPYSTRQRVELMARVISNTLKERPQ